MINIVVASNDNYLPHAATMLCSLIENNTEIFYIFFLYNGINKNKLKKLTNFVKKHNSYIKTIKIQNDELSSLKLQHHFTSQNYYRLIIPDILPINIRKVLYFDCDLIIRKPIKALWSYELEDNYLAAVENIISDDHKKNLGLSSDAKYFNSGVMLINIDKWRKESLHREVIDFIKANPDIIEYADQDGLNAVLDGNWINLPITWNTQHTHFIDLKYQKQINNLIDGPAIVHFTGSGLKPWQLSNYYHPYFSEYFIYRQKTPWKIKEIKAYKRKSIINKLKRIVNILLQERNNFV